MKFSAAAVLAVAAGAQAHRYNGNVTIVTEVVDTYVTYCPEATQITHNSKTYIVTEITHNSKTYIVTEPTTLTITDCPCTQTRTVPVTSAPVAPTGSSRPGGVASFTNSTIVPAPTGAAPGSPVGNPGNPDGNPGNPAGNPGNPGSPVGAGTGAPSNVGPVPTAPNTIPSTVPTAGAGKAAVLSGAGLAGLVGLAAFLL
ncbi:Clock-controlled protein 6 [Escovopsis weberi]|uniref:Clock-controlled protein 6 n=1 Tax=Escovopsis weberi TaxID=150374 RepID=A0A0M8MZJ1_ESCWE|nr:Clock-controlled protein 6 [Escovopsis weberi]